MAATSVKVTVAGVTTSSMILATLQTDAGAVAVANAAPCSCLPDDEPGDLRVDEAVDPSSAKVPSGLRRRKRSRNG